MASVTPASEMMPCRSEGCSKVSRRTLNLDEFAADSTLEGGVRCELVSKVSFIRRSDEFLESIKKGIETVEPGL